ncbi:MAG: hypothetical protein AAF214_01865 [Pseudomonadota bacterium]
MTQRKVTALAKLTSLKITTMNAIAELEMRAEAAADAGDTAAETQHINTAIALAQQSVLIRKAEDEIRAGMSLTTAIDQLDDISRDGRTTLKNLRKAADALEHATTLLTILARLSALL